MRKSKGFTLIEIMIALLLGLIIISATISIYIATVRSSSDTVKSARLNHDLEMVMSLMINDIRRAGQWGGAIASSNSGVNPFTQVPDVTKGQANINIPNANCVLYTYDADGDGHYDEDNDNFGDSEDDNNEFYGFKLDSGTIKIRINVPTGTTYANCSETGTSCCSSTYGNWQEMVVGDDVEITGLTFDTKNSKCLNKTQNANWVTPNAGNDPKIIFPCDDSTLTNYTKNTGDQFVETRTVNITLSGRLKNDTAVTKSLTGTVKIRNDRVFTQ